MGIGWIIGLAITGLVAGSLGRLIVPGRQRMGIAMTILVGVGGAFLGGAIGRVLFGRPGGLVLAVAGSALIVYLLSRARRV